VVAVAFAAGALAPAAGAATVSNVHAPAARGGPVTYTAAAGEVNRLIVTADARSVLFGDAAGITAPDPGPPAMNDCVASGATASCPLAPVSVALEDQNDVVTAGAGAPSLSISAGDGSDVLLDPVRTPGTAFDGGAGIDRADYSGRAGPLSISLNGIADDGAAGEADDIAAEDLVGGAGDDTITTDAAANGLSGGAGDDFVSADAGADTVEGGAGNDTIDGGADDDTIRGGDGADQLIGGPGNDLISGGPGADAITAGAGNDTISAADGVAETIDCGAGVDTLVADLGANGVTDTRVGCESVVGPAVPPPAAPATPAAAAAAAPGLIPVLAPGVANPADLTPPKASMRTASRQRLRTVVARGVPVRVTCGEACGVSIALSIERATARRLGLDARVGPVVVGTATAKRSVAGSVQLRVRFIKKTRARLRRGRRIVLTAQVLVSDASGNGTLLTRRVTLVR
jgi:RTX calcium-binding nonapeptide repeat (4 copies)